MQDRLSSLAEMAERLQRSPRQFRKDVTNYHIPHIKLGAKLLFDAQRVLEYLTAKDARTRTPGPIQKRSNIKPRVPDDTRGRFAGRLGL